VATCCPAGTGIVRQGGAVALTARGRHDWTATLVPGGSHRVRKRFGESALPKRLGEIFLIKNAADDMNRTRVASGGGLGAIDHSVVANLQGLPIWYGETFNGKRRVRRAKLVTKGLVEEPATKPSKAL